MNTIRDFVYTVCKERRISTYWREFLLLALAAMTITTYVLLVICGIPGVPNANDLAFVLNSKNEILNASGFLECLCAGFKGAFDTMIETYMTWGGHIRVLFFQH